MIESKMIELYKVYVSTSGDPDKVNQYINENIFIEPYINTDTVAKVIEIQQKGSRINLNSITDENKLIALVVISLIFHTNLYKKWLRNLSIGKYNISIFSKFLMPKYRDLVEKNCLWYSEFKKALDKYDMRISFDTTDDEVPLFDTDHTQLEVALFYDKNHFYSSRFSVNNLNSYTLNQIVEKAEICNNITKSLITYKDDVSNLLLRIYTRLDDDKYTLKKMSIWPSSNNDDTKRLIIEFSASTTCSVLHDYNVVSIGCDIRIIDDRHDVIAKIYRNERAIDLENFNESIFYDLDEIFNVISKAIDSDFKKIEFLE